MSPPTHGVNHLGDQHQRRDFARVAASLRPLGDNHVNARRLVACRVLWPSTHGANGDVMGAQLLHHIWRRRAKRTYDEADLGVAQRDL